MDTARTDYTMLEEAVFCHPAWRAMSAGAGKEEKQKILDAVSDEILSLLDGAELQKSIIDAYHGTLPAYRENPHTQGIIRELIRFINLDELPAGAKILDLGCGYGRDTLFMAIDCPVFRLGLMQRRIGGKAVWESYVVPEKSFQVVGVDGASNMISAAKHWLFDLSAVYAQAGKDSYPRFLVGDMHRIDVRDESNRPLSFDGIWSCTALFTHTPHDLLQTAMRSVANVLKPGGVFFVSYTNGRPSGRYNKLILSSTGRIKWFSQPDPDEIISLAARCGMKLMADSTFSDYAQGADFARDLFVSHFFRKEG
jgi:SAM-dependent methyltransferase